MDKFLWCLFFFIWWNFQLWSFFALLVFLFNKTEGMKRKISPENGYLQRKTKRKSKGKILCEKFAAVFFHYELSDFSFNNCSTRHFWLVCTFYSSFRNAVGKLCKISRCNESGEENAKVKIEWNLKWKFFFSTNDCCCERSPKSIEREKRIIKRNLWIHIFSITMISSFAFDTLFVILTGDIC